MSSEEKKPKSRTPKWSSGINRGAKKMRPGLTEIQKVLIGKNHGMARGFASRKVK